LACPRLPQASSTVALKLVRVAPAAAVNYLSVVWALAADYLVFSHAPTPLSLAGAALVCGSTLGLMLWEARGGGKGGRKGSRSEPGGGGDGRVMGLGVGEGDLKGGGEEERLLQPLEQGGSKEGVGLVEQQLAERSGAARAKLSGDRSPRWRHGESGPGQEQGIKGPSTLVGLAQGSTRQQGKREQQQSSGRES
jgi:hypothetical protein